MGLTIKLYVIGSRKVRKIILKNDWIHPTNKTKFKEWQKKFHSCELPIMTMLHNMHHTIITY